jgi:hypothetical protein
MEGPGNGSPSVSYDRSGAPKAITLIRGCRDHRLYAIQYILASLYPRTWLGNASKSLVVVKRSPIYECRLMVGSTTRDRILPYDTKSLLRCFVVWKNLDALSYSISLYAYPRTYTPHGRTTREIFGPAITHACLVTGRLCPSFPTKIFNRHDDDGESFHPLPLKIPSWPWSQH